MECKNEYFITVNDSYKTVKFIFDIKDYRYAIIQKSKQKLLTEFKLV